MCQVICHTCIMSNQLHKVSACTNTINDIFLQKGALTTAEVCEALGLGHLKNRSWHVQGAISIRGEGLYEGLDWYESPQ